MENLKINRDSPLSIVEQIVSYYKAAILTRRIQNNVKLPSERQLSSLLGVARGTISKAYQQLVDLSLVESKHNDGYYVSFQPQILNDITKKHAMDLMDHAFDQLYEMGLTDTEIVNIIKLKISAQKSLENINILIVSNNHLILSKLESELSYLTQKTFYLFTLSFMTLNSIQISKNPSDLLMTYDLIIATIIDYDQLVEIIPEHNHKILRANIVPTNSTLKLLSSLPKYSRITVIYRTDVFKQLVIDTLTNLGFKFENIYAYYEHDYNPKNHSLNGVNAIINFNESPLYTNPAFQQRNHEFILNGGKIIHFEYMLTRTSLTAIEERIHSIKVKR
ncbi:hypothetical protein AOC36_11465 [Erysipelothrix larvae]|uniref:HTH gntR-type domain-containing protein n=1 Tax=Erysipelothrix larvae TaxID=1514105 RepID=A0A0X8H1X2_9FIRM|nr:GntR family transcriptional regulator [Erysipelothrix larvae]AMC94567.1 hypothetical protein AOC36_11465 [Erysipelothrix larvae]